MEGKKRLNEKVVKTLEAQPLWYVSTCSDVPENAIVGFHEVLDDRRLLRCDVFMKNTRHG
ncbi:MAG: hypothetical protein Q4B48_02035 [Syntrophomonadaceae bacterium]|nr:hypothetical protein [Syntrophomonadaceae bacterium]